MRVLVLHPPILPYGYTLHHRFARIWEFADYLRRKSYDVVVLDAGLLNCLKGRVLAEFCKEYDAALFYCENQAIPVTLDLAHRCRAIAPATKIFAYGPGPICFPEHLRLPLFDGIGLRGDLEAQARQFLEFVVGATPPFPNVAVQGKQGWVAPSGPVEFVAQEEWGYPDLAEMPIEDLTRVYAMKNDSLKVAVTASKGCPYGCTFCHIPSVEGARDRRRDPEELVSFVDRHSFVFPEWQFYAPTFTLDRDWCLTFCEELQRLNRRIQWKCTTRVDHLDVELIEAMRRAGCYSVGLGIETLGPARKLIRKGIADDAIRYAITELRSDGIVPKAYVMLGLPGQTQEHFHETIRFVSALGAVVRPYVYMPQGEADGLRDEVSLDSSMQMRSGLDGRGEGLQLEEFGEFLRIAFSGSF